MSRLGTIGYVAGQRFPSQKADTHQVIKTVSALTAEGLDIELVIPKAATLRQSDAELAEELLRIYAARQTIRFRFVPALPRLRDGVESEVAGFFAPFLPAVRRYQLLYVRHWGSLLGVYLSRRPFVYENHRLLRRQYPKRVPIIRHMQKRRRFLGVVTNADLVTRAYVELGFRPEQALTAHNGFDPCDMEPRLSKVEAREKLGLEPAARYVFYSGNLQSHKGVESILPVAKRTPHVTYLFAGGNEGQLARFRRLIAEAGLDNVRLLGWKNHTALTDYHYAADICIVPPASSPLRRIGRSTVVPMKLYGYLAAGRPTVAPDMEDMREVLVHEGNAVLCEPDSTESCVVAIERIVNDAELAQRLGEQARADAAQYTWRQRAWRIIAFLARRVDAAGL